MAISALENRIVVRIRMARSAHSIRAAMVDRELRVLRVIERRIQPVRRAMAVLARRREELRLRGMPRIGRVVVVGQVAVDARRAGQVVVIVDVAIGASPWRNRMGARQWESGLRVIELAIRPLDGVMAEFAGGRESRMRHRTVRTIEIVLVARNASRVRDVVVVVDVAVGAGSWRNRMRARQRESGLRVIEFAVRPLDGVMAVLASGREAGVRHRTLRAIEVVLVARNAGRVGDVVVVVDVAVGARPRRDRMGSSERPTGLRVIELAIRPLDGVMALLAGGGEAGVRHRTLCAIEVVLVARNAGRVRDVVVVVDVAVRARPWRDGVRSGQRETSLRVIELAIRPLNRVMTLFASGREPRVWYRRFRIVVVGLVAGNAGRVRDVVVVVDVAVGARPWRNRVGTGQRESGLRVIELGIRPLDCVVALLAGRREAGVRHGADSTAEILRMARNARSIRDVVVVVDVAVGAGPRWNSMRPGQGERGFRVVETCRLPR